MPYVWTVPAEAEGERLDRWLVGQRPELSRARIQTLIRGGSVQLDGRGAKPSTRLTSGARVTFEIPPHPRAVVEPEPMDLAILHEDDDIVVVNKPSGLVVHPAAGHERGTLVNGLLHERALASGHDPSRPGIVHRLDKATSGAIVVAKRERAHASLVEQFKARSVGKTYVALVHGVLADSEGRIDAPIGRHPKHAREQAVRADGGKAALTDFRALRTFGDRTLVAAFPRTGRTHQIRVHLAAIGHPVVGDPLYGRSVNGETLMLHAWRLALDHPATGERMAFTAALPPRFRSVVEAVEELELTAWARPPEASE
ncbi:MAG: RluA family pseudouridine synthase [Candidatus Bipolaricaulia bacterium]